MASRRYIVALLASRTPADPADVKWPRPARLLDPGLRWPVFLSTVRQLEQQRRDAAS